MALPQSRVLPEVGYPVASGDTAMSDEYRATTSKAALKVWAGRLLWVWVVVGVAWGGWDRIIGES
jgi:hypothetical protein